MTQENTEASTANTAADSYEESPEARAAFLRKVTRGAVVPQHLIPYLSVVSEFTPELCGSCLVYFTEPKPEGEQKKAYSSDAVKYSSTFTPQVEESGAAAYVIGYPINDPDAGVTGNLPDGHVEVSQAELAEAIQLALAKKDVKRITVLSPVRPECAPEWAICQDAAYWLIDLDPQKAPPSKKVSLFASLFNKINITMEPWGKDHEILVNRYLSMVQQGTGGSHVYKRLHKYLAECSDTQLFSLRSGYSSLDAFAVADFSSKFTAFYMFSLVGGRPTPSTFQYLLTAVAMEAQRRGYYTLNAGLGTEYTMGSLAKTWKARPFLPYTETSWSPQGITEADKKALKAAKKGAVKETYRLDKRQETGDPSKPQEPQYDWKKLLLSLFWPIRKK